MTMRLPLPLYYLLITTITELILLSGAVLILLPTGFLKQLPLGVFGFLFIYKTIIATIVLIIMAHKRWHENAVLIMGGGRLLGGLVGLLLGGILGGRYGGVLWAIVGIISFYMLVGQIGAKISSAIGNQLDRIFSSPGEIESVRTVRLARPTGLLLIIYGLIAPTLLVVTAIFFSSSGIPSSRYSEELPIARIAAIGLSLFSVFLPWLLQTRWMMKSTTSIVSQENAIFISGMGLSIAPVVYGFILFIAFGASIIELGIFAVASTLVAIIWSANTKLKQQNAG